MTAFDFDDVAERYDEWYDNPVGRAYDSIQKRAIGRVLEPPTNGRLMLEVGCGTGHWTAFFARSGFSVIGVDVSRKMLRVASAKGISEARYALANAQNLPFENGAFDVACAVTALEFIEDADAAIVEIARCVRPGGTIVVGVLNRVSLLAWLRRRRNSPLFSEARLMSMAELDRLLGAVGDATVYSTAFLLPWRGLLWLSVVLNAVGRLLRLPFGDFIVGIVKIQSL